jgi:hypothetical protein
LCRAGWSFQVVFIIFYHHHEGYLGNESHGCLALPQAAKGFAERCQQLWSATGGASRGRCLRHVAGGASCVKSNDWVLILSIWNLCTVYYI